MVIPLSISFTVSNVLYIVHVNNMHHIKIINLVLINNQSPTHSFISDSRDLLVKENMAPR